MTAQQAIEAALRLIGAVDVGEDPTPKELEDGLETLNAMLGYWGTQRFGNFVQTQNSHALTANVGSYTIGTGQTINTTCPSKIVTAFIRDSANTDFAMEIIAQEQYSDIPTKTLTGVPEKIYLAKSSGTVGTIYLYPVPANVYTLYIDSLKPLGSYALTDSLGLPAEYDRAIRFNLAIELAAEYGVEPRQTVVANAIESLTTLKAMRAYPPASIRTDPLNGQEPFDIYRGY